MITSSYRDGLLMLLAMNVQSPIDGEKQSRALCTTLDKVYETFVADLKEQVGVAARVGVGERVPGEAQLLTDALLPGAGAGAPRNDGAGLLPPRHGPCSQVGARQVLH